MMIQIQDRVSGIIFGILIYRIYIFKYKMYNINYLQFDKVKKKIDLDYKNLELKVKVT